MEGEIRKENTEPGAVTQEQDIVIPVLQEEVVTGKRKVRKATIIIRKSVSVEDADIDIPLEEEHYSVERVPMEQYLDTAPDIRQEGDTVIIPVVKEVIIKKLLLTEEIRITKNILKTKTKSKVSLKKQEVTVTRTEH